MRCNGGRPKTALRKMLIRHQEKAPHNASQLSKSSVDIASGETNDREPRASGTSERPFGRQSWAPWWPQRRQGTGGEHDTNAARADREGSSQRTLEQALEPKRELDRDRGALNRLGFERRRVQQLPRIHVVGPRSYAALARSRVTVVR